MGKAGRVLKVVLETYEISQNRLAVTLGVGRSNVYRWVNEVRDPTSETVISIMKALEELDVEAAAEFRRLYMSDSIQDEDKL